MDPELLPGSGTRKIQSWIQIRNKSFRIRNTGLVCVWQVMPDETHNGGGLSAARHAAYQAKVLRHHTPNRHGDDYQSYKLQHQPPCGSGESGSKKSAGKTKMSYVHEKF